jgi:enolase
MKIDFIRGRQVIDSRGNPTVEVEVGADAYRAFAIAPSGASTGKYEACELRDGDSNLYLGRSVMKAVGHVNSEIASAIGFIDIENQERIDKALIACDGTENKSKIGANAILATSLAVSKLSAMFQGKRYYRYINELLGVSEIKPFMPTPFINILNGGVHADNKIDIQEFMIVPVKDVTFAEKIRMSCEVFHVLKNLLKKDGMNVNVGDEGGFAPNLDNTEAAVQYLIRAIEGAGYKLNQDISLALDVAASSFSVGENSYNLDGKVIKSPEMISFLSNLVDKYGIISIEDGLGEEDYEGWKNLTQKIGERVQLVGDDLFVTNEKLLRDGVENKYANSILIKPNQIGTLTETLNTIRFAHKNGYKYMISHRSGESEDSTIAHIAVGTGAGQIKTGSVCRGERTAKYNELIRIEELL